MKRRFDTHFQARPELVTGLAADHPAVTGARTLFPSTVVDPTASPRLLISGVNQRKIGSHVTKGAWTGMPIFCLTLEERASCPASCHNWRACYGNGMHFARRHAHGANLEYLLERELTANQAEHPAGFVVRLHILGDFYDAAYVALWGRWLRTYPALRVFGFTARDELSDEGLLVRSLNRDFPGRWAIRFSAPKSRGVPGVQYVTTLHNIPATPVVDGAVVCPAQTGRTECCATCGFCWTGAKDVAFIAHGRGAPSPGDEDQAEGADDAGPGMPVELPTPGALPPAARRGPARKEPQRQTAATGRSAVEARQASASLASAVDPTASVPLRAIEIRAWLQGVKSPVPDTTSAAAMLTLANTRRAEMSLPPFRLIPEHEGARYQENILPISSGRMVREIAHA